MADLNGVPVSWYPRGGWRQAGHACVPALRGREGLAMRILALPSLLSDTDAER